jgi:D-aminopeptidase
VCFGWKGGIGTSSRVLPPALGGATVGALVQSNFGGVLQVDGLQLGRLLGQHYLHDELASADGSIMIVLATDAPLSDRNLRRLAARAMAGLARTGASMSNGSGDYAIAFSTAPEVRRTRGRRSRGGEWHNDEMSPMFHAAIEATEEAILNSLCMAETMTGFRGRMVQALPLDVLRKMSQAR